MQCPNSKPPQIGIFEQNFENQDIPLLLFFGGLKSGHSALIGTVGRYTSRYTNVTHCGCLISKGSLQFDRLRKQKIYNARIYPFVKPVFELDGRTLICINEVEDVLT